ncbi:NAD(P)/FAD-dependent oxidoreductase [Qiania dongpingensis]|uniref:FAD-dependent oxidoreductase n=1 Tax=Qiania dongpingensis TaxID=2763669 RepID=A0A7G9G6V6_9FIRM|nr:FAD-dependent oxidoreductase [Qiania dongpingensis]QNM06538.1 FAD-dependent oxidoreductase [Qiania dongpingensis]
MKHYELVIVGGGSAGMAAALEARREGVSSILILEQGKELGGVLLQCIHNGFGLHTFGEELTGPAYAERYIRMVEKEQIETKTETTVLHIGKDRSVTYVNSQDGYRTVQAGAVILAMGCRERPRGALSIPGYRPAGIWTAGTAQRYMNLEGCLVGRRVWILGSGDIGMIMARRMTLEGAEVLGVAEVMPYSNGLPRNRRQCLEDFEIPLYLSHTVTRIKGKERVEAVVISRVDENRRPIPGTEQEFAVDTLLLSVGLIPENALSEETGILLDGRTKGPSVNSSYESKIAGIFACGNVLHVHDLVDHVSMEGEQAGKAAAAYLSGMQAGETEKAIEVPAEAGEGLSYVLPQRIRPGDAERDGGIEFKFRVRRSFRRAVLEVRAGEVLIKSVRKKYLEPSVMETVQVKWGELSHMGLFHKEDEMPALRFFLREEAGRDEGNA